MKELDLFGVPVSANLNFERHNSKTNKVQHHTCVGSYFGGIMSVYMVINFLSWFIMHVSEVETGQHDGLKHIIHHN
jgi:extradiol dioxygenase family protein